jgi:hypothetical protein
LMFGIATAVGRSQRRSPVPGPGSVLGPPVRPPAVDPHDAVQGCAVVEVRVGHFVQIAVPFGLFLPQPWATVR